VKGLTTKQVAEAVGIAALLASLIFLAVEINQSNTIAISSIQYAILSDFNEYHRDVLGNPELAELISKLENASDTAFTPAESVRVHAFVTNFINIWFAIQTAHDNGQLSDNDFRIYVEDVQSSMLHYPRAIPYFKKSIASTPSILGIEIFQPILDADEIPSQ